MEHYPLRAAFLPDFLAVASWPDVHGNSSHADVEKQIGAKLAELQQV